MAKEAAPAKKKMTKSQVVNELATKANLTKKQVGEFIEALRGVMKAELGKRGPGQFEIPGIVRFKVRAVAAHKKEVRNPQTGEKIMKSFDASRKVRATPVKALKDLVQ
jgi:nucleoid DNA-binding protein